MACRLDDRVAGLQVASVLGLQYNVARHPVLHRAAWVEVLRLHENAAGILEWCVSDGIKDAHDLFLGWSGLKGRGP